MSFFMLLVVAMGLSVVKESLGRTMLKCQILAGAHFLFGSKCAHFLIVACLFISLQSCILSELSSCLLNQHLRWSFSCS